MKNNDYDYFADNVPKWSEDWENFDWEIVREKLKAVKKEFGDTAEGKKQDVGITAEQFKEFLQWLQENEPEEYDNLILYMILRERGMEKQDIDFCLSHLEALEKALDTLQDEE